MKKIKKIFFLLLIILLTGCNVEYTLTINSDSSVSEKVVATEDTNRMKAKTNLSDKQSINFLYNIYKREGIDATVDSRKDENNTIATVFAQHNNIDEYKNNFTSDLFKEVNILKNDNITTIEAIQSIKIDSTASRGLMYDSVDVIVNIPFVVTYNNAEEIKGNNYIWHIKKDEELKTIKISYKDKEIKNSLKVNINNKVYNFNYGYIILFFISISLAVTFLIIFNKNKKNNKV